MPALVGYDLEKLTTPTALPRKDLVRLAEVAAGRRILSEGNVVPLSSSESLDAGGDFRSKTIRAGGQGMKIAVLSDTHSRYATVGRLLAELRGGA